MERADEGWEISSEERKMTIKNADKIRKYVFERYIKPAQESGLTSVSFRAKDIHLGMELEKHDYPNIIKAVCNKAMKTHYGVKNIRKEPPSDAPDVIITYEL